MSPLDQLHKATTATELKQFWQRWLQGNNDYDSGFTLDSIRYSYNLLRKLSAERDIVLDLPPEPAGDPVACDAALLMGKSAPVDKLLLHNTIDEIVRFCQRIEPNEIQAALNSFGIPRIQKADGENKHLQELAPPRLIVDLTRKTVTLDGMSHDVPSDRALRWVKILVEHRGEWFSGKDLERYDTELINVRTDKLREFLPKEVDILIDSKTGAGSRIRF